MIVVLVNVILWLLLIAILYLIGKKLLEAVKAEPIFFTILYIAVLLLLLLVILGIATGYPGMRLVY